MVCTNSHNPLDSWEGLCLLPSAVQRQLSKQLRNIVLEPGEQLHSFNHLPPGILYLKEGQMRLLGTNLRKEPFTLDRYKAGDLVGAELLLRGAPGLCLAASNIRGTTTSCQILSSGCSIEPQLVQAFTQRQAAMRRRISKDPLSPHLDLTVGTGGMQIFQRSSNP